MVVGHSCYEIKPFVNLNHAKFIVWVYTKMIMDAKAGIGGRYHFSIETKNGLVILFGGTLDNVHFVIKGN